MRQTEMDQKLKERPQKKVARVQTDNPTPISLNGFTLQNIWIVKGLSCLSVSDILIWWQLQIYCNTDGYSNYLLAREANIGEATRSPTIKADDKTPSSKLFKLKSPLHTKRKI